LSNEFFMSKMSMEHAAAVFGVWREGFRRNKAVVTEKSPMGAELQNLLCIVDFGSRITSVFGTSKIFLESIIGDLAGFLGEFVLDHINELSRQFGNGSISAKSVA